LIRFELILTQEQVEAYNLPPVSGTSDKVELDALDAYVPNEMEKVIEAKLNEYIDLELFKEVEKLETEHIDKTLNYALEHLDFSGTLEDINIDLSDCPEFDLDQLPMSKIVEEKDIQWMYDSSRDYWDQLAYFKVFKPD